MTKHDTHPTRTAVREAVAAVEAEEKHAPPAPPAAAAAPAYCAQHPDAPHNDRGCQAPGCTFVAPPAKR